METILDFIVSMRYIGNYKNKNSFQYMNDEQKIVKFAAYVFIQKGFSKTTMDFLASEMGISKKTIYKYFPSKYSLLEKAILTFQGKIRLDLNRIADSNESVVKKIYDMSEYFAEFSLLINKNFLNDIYKHQPKLWLKIDELRSSVIVSIWEKIIIEGKKNNLVIDKSNEIIIAIILSALTGVINPKFLSKNNITTTEAFEETFYIIINGILSEKGKIEFKKQEWNRK